MWLEETAMDNLNRMATDILCCPDCMSEDLDEIGCEYDETEGFPNNTRLKNLESTRRITIKQTGWRLLPVRIMRLVIGR